jgi:hypothetical protein
MVEVLYEVFFTIIIAGLALIMKVEINYLEGMLYAALNSIRGFIPRWWTAN